MPTWTLTPVSGSETNFQVPDYKADPKGVVLSFAITSEGGTGTYHLAPAHKQREVNGMVSGGLEVASDFAGAVAGFKAGEEMVSKFGGHKGVIGAAEGAVEGLAGAALGAFLAHTAKHSLENLYEKGEIDAGDYYNQAGIVRFRGLIKVSKDGNSVTE